MVLCVLLIIAAALFGSKKTVDVFGFNIYLVQTDDIPSAPKGSAVFVEKETAAGLSEGKLALYLNAEDIPALGYVKEMSARDGVTYITVDHNNEPFEFSESKLIGRADYASVFLGGLLGFIRTPLGILAIAVLPCAALILFDIARAAAANRPEPEVVPQVKNADEELPHTDVKLSVDTEGKASYAKDRSLKPLPKDSDVLFSYSGRQKSVPGNIPRSERPIIPLTDRRSRPKSPDTPVPETSSETSPVTAETSTARSSKPNAGVVRPAPSVSEDSAPSGEKATEQGDERVPDKTAEIPVINTRKPDDAFFAQSSVGAKPFPQIGKQRPAQPLDDAQQLPAHGKPSGKRSAQILASRGLEDLFSDDDDEGATL